MAFNRQWINQKMDQGCTMIDIGRKSGSPSSAFYNAELEEINKRGYTNVVNGGVAMNEFTGAITLSAYARDFDASRDFYCSVLGFEVDMDVWLGEGTIEQPIRRLRLIFAVNPQIAVEFFHPDQPVTVTEVPHLTLTARNVRAARERAATTWPQAFVRFDETPFGEFLTLRDPSGNVVQVAEEFVVDE